MENYIDKFESRPGRFVIKILLWLFLVGCVGGVLSYACGLMGDAAQTAKKEFSASALLKKYEWFKDASAQLDNKVATIAVYNVRIQGLQDEYKGVKRQEWARDDREQLSIWQSELAGIKGSYNVLAAEYNAAMAKFNYRFCNVGELPSGATHPLPRDYKPYHNN